MSKRISVWGTLGSSLSKGASSIATDMGAPARALTLRGKRLAPFTAAPKYIALEDKALAEPILKGEFSIKGQSLSLGTTGEPWSTPVPSEAFAGGIHRFEFLYALASYDSQAAQACAQRLTDSWIFTYGKWNTFSWQPDIITDRLFAWLATWKPLLAGDDGPAQNRRSNVYRQSQYLKSKYKAVTPGLPRLKAATTLALSGAMMDNKTLLDQSLDRLDEQLELQVLGDGGHISRRPKAVIEILYALLTLESALEVKGVQGSKQTRRAIDRLGPALTFFTLPDGKLSSFHGSGEYDAKAIKALAKQAGKPKKPFGFMPHSGYQRLEQNGTVILIDTGDSPPRPYDCAAHIAPLAFELCAPSGRLIVNCGFNSNQVEGWRSAIRETAAHSTLIIDNCSAGHIIDSRIHGTAIERAAGPANGSRKELDGGVWLDSYHNGYLPETGLAHRRRIYMDALGVDIRGEDKLVVPMGKQPRFTGASFAYNIRFHIHPDVRVTLARDLKSALLILPNGDGWRFRADRGPLSLERSVYLARGSKAERGEQIVINGDALCDNNGEDRSNQVRWSFKRLGKVGDD